jgi:hypothetical protein
MRLSRHLGTLAAAAALLVLFAGCGNTEHTLDPLLSKVDRARDAQAISSLQQALTSAALVRSETGGGYGSGPDDLARQLQARDPSKRFSTAPSAAPEQVQVLGGGAQPVMLVVRSVSNAYLAVYLDGTGATLYYRGLQPPRVTNGPPTGAGWTQTPPT